MSSIDLTPLYRSSVGFDPFGLLLDSALHSDKTSTGYPPYNIETVDDDHYAITLAVAGFDHDELDIQVENNVMTVSGSKADSDKKDYLYRGISTRNFEQKFNLADYVEVKGANLNNGLLSIDLVKELPEAMKPRRIHINTADKVLEHKAESNQAA